MFKRIAFIMLVLLMITGVAYAQPSWTQVPLRTAAQAQPGVDMPGGEGFQNIFGISYAPSNPDILYLVSNTSQVWKSVDGDNSWQRKHNGFLANGGLSLAVHPTDPDTVFVAGTSGQSDINCSMEGSPVQGVSNKCADGIYRTTDEGESWEMVEQTPFYNIGSKVGGVNLAFAGEGTIYAGTHTKGLLKSTNGGDTYTWSSLNILTGTKILDIKIHPQDSSIIFLSAESGLYKLTDNGEVPLPLEQLEQIGAGLPSFPKAIAVAINPNDGNIVIYVTVELYWDSVANKYKSGVYKSTDGGYTFSKKNTGLWPAEYWVNPSPLSRQENGLYLVD